MKLGNGNNQLGFVLSGLIGGITAGLLVGGGFLLSSLRPASPPNLVSASQTPTLDKLDDMRCARGLTLITQVRGQEDGFARAGLEPSDMDRGLMRYASFDDLDKGRSRTLALRNFDELGPDKVLIQNFEIPKGVVSGTIFLRVKGVAAGSDNDYVRLLSSVSYKSQTGADRLISFSTALQDINTKVTTLNRDNSVTGLEPGSQRGIDRLIEIDLESFKGVNGDPASSVIGYFNQFVTSNVNASRLLTLGVYDDTAVDVAALALCVEPDAVRGVTFVEHSDKRLGADISLLSCANDETQSMCGPYTGDTLCSEALPLGCYKDGAIGKPANLAKAQINDANFVGGEVRATQPVAASTFATIVEADAFCVSNFGAGWRVLTYQEGGGGVVISQSQIKPRTRLWIDIRDQPRARCWDRPVNLAVK